MSDKEKYSVDDFWPGAEELLDKHFKSKSIWQRTSPFAKGATLLVLLLSAFLVFKLNDETSNPALTENTIEKNDNLSSINNEFDSQSAELNYQTTTSNTNLTVGSDYSNEQEVILNEEINLSVNSASSSKDDLNENNHIQTNTGAPGKSEPNAERKSKSNQSEEYILEVNNSSSLNSAIQGSMEDEQRKVENANEEIQSSEQVNNSVEQNKSIETNNAENLNNSRETNFNSIDYREFSGDLSNVREEGQESIVNAAYLDRMSSKINSAAANSKTQLISLNGLSFNSHLLIDDKEISIDNLQPAFSPIKNHRKNVFQYELNASVFYVNKSLLSNQYKDYASRRNSEEQAAYFTSYGFGVNYRFNNWTINSGLELNQYGEKTNYNSYLKGEVISIINYENYQLDTLVTPYTSYLQGNEYVNFNTQYTTDTIVVYDTTSAVGDVEVSSSEFNSKTMLSYLEIPLSIAYEIPLSGRFTTGVRAGVSLGFLRERRGYYLDAQLYEFVDLQKVQTFNSIMLNIRAGFDLNYYLRPGLGLFLRPEYRGSLQSVFNKTSGINQRYSSYGLTFGVSKTF
jgi:hypothetical protein